jgi:hypothetical protein
MEQYCYIFVRQDLTPEQQLIQFGHVCALVGATGYRHDFNKVNFVGIGVPNENELYRALFLMIDNGVQNQKFKEPDLGDTLTAVASLPVSGDTRAIFRHYDTLRFAAF